MESGLVFVTVFFSIIGVLLLICVIYNINRKKKTLPQYEIDRSRNRVNDV